MQATATANLWERRRVRETLGNGLAYLLLTALGVLFALPFIWMLSASLKVEADIWTYPPVWIPNPILWSNYPEALALMKFPRLLYNTVLITGLSMVGTLLSCTWVVYGFARFRFPGRDLFFVLLLATMMLPAQVTMIPLFILFRDLGWLNTFLPLIVPAFFGNAFFIFLLRQFFMTIPTELDDAAKIDGCSYVGIWWRILLPLTKPALAAVAIFAFIGNWNDFLFPLIYLNDEAKFTLTLGLATFRGVYSTQWAYLMAASVVVLLPCLIVFFLAQKQFVEGITFAGLQG
jgi:ABC-type glycerol-3-phosphate transport system permease component